MKSQLMFGLVAALCVLGVRSSDEAAAAGAESGKAKICEPGTRSEVACNTCICSNDGTEQACTKKICVEGLPQNLPAPLGGGGDDDVKPQNLPVVDADLEKVPETKIDAQGEAKDGSRRRRRRRRDTTEAEEACEPGKLFLKDNCNQCECPESGKRSQAQICTAISC